MTVILIAFGVTGLIFIAGVCVWMDSVLKELKQVNMTLKRLRDRNSN